MTGEKYDEYSKTLERQDQILKQLGMNLNFRADKATENIRENGGVYIFNKVNTEVDQINNKNNNRNNTFNSLSINSSKLQKLRDLLKDINTSTKFIDSKVSGIVDSSNKLGIPNFYDEKDKSKIVINSTTELKDKLEKLIQDTENTEQENSDIIEALLKKFGYFSRTTYIEKDFRPTRTTKKPTRK